MRRISRPAWLRALARILRSASAHRVPPMAGEAAFFAALAVFPTLLTVVSVVRAAGALLGPGADVAAAQGLTALLRIVLTTRGSTAAEASGELLTDGGGDLFTVGTVAASFLLARALRSVLHALGLIAGNDGRRRLWPAAILLAVATLLGAAVVLAAAVQDPLRVLAVPRGEAIWSVLRWPVAAAALLGWALLLLRVGLGRRYRRRALLVGAAVTTVGWFTASLLFPLYVAVATRFTDTVGALGGGLILLVWLYLLMLVLYLGAEVCTSVQGDAPEGREPPAPAEQASDVQSRPRHRTATATTSTPRRTRAR